MTDNTDWSVFNRTLQLAQRDLSEAGFIVPMQAARAATEAEIALAFMWSFATLMVAKHGMNGDDTMTDADHKMWQDAAGRASMALTKAGQL